MASWPHVAIRELVKAPDFQEDEIWIQSKLIKKIPLPEIKKALKYLIAVDALKRNSKGELESREIINIPSQDLGSEALKRFHEDIYELAKYSIRNIEVNKRLHTGLTLSIQESDYEQLVTYLATVQKNIIKKFSSPSETKKQVQIQHIEFAIIPLTKTNQEFHKSLL